MLKDPTSPSLATRSAHIAICSSTLTSLLGHRGLVLNEPIGDLARLQLGRAYMMSADLAKSRAAYQMFPDLRKEADPDITPFHQAKSEYAELLKKPWIDVQVIWRSSPAKSLLRLFSAPPQNAKWERASATIASSR